MITNFFPLHPIALRYMDFRPSIGVGSGKVVGVCRVVVVGGGGGKLTFLYR